MNKIQTAGNEYDAFLVLPLNKIFFNAPFPNHTLIQT
jgi:hypothetical protein